MGAQVVHERNNRALAVSRAWLWAIGYSRIKRPNEPLALELLRSRRERVRARSPRSPMRKISAVTEAEATETTTIAMAGAGDPSQLVSSPVGMRVGRTIDIG